MMQCVNNRRRGRTERGGKVTRCVYPAFQREPPEVTTPRWSVRRMARRAYIGSIHL